MGRYKKDKKINKKNFSKVKKILITGSQGFLGKNLLNFLKKKNLHVVGDGKKFDLKNIKETKKLFYKSKPDIVIHCAGKTGGVSYTSKYPATILRENIKINSNIFEIASSFQIKKLILIGASCVYPDKKNIKLSEKLMFNGPFHPSVEAYGFWKLSQIITMNAYKKEFDLNSFCIIFPNIYGPGDDFKSKNSHVIGALINKFFDAKKKKKSFVNCLGTGDEIRDCIYIDDAVSAIHKIINKKFNFNYINISTGKGFKIKFLAKLIKKKINYKGEITWENLKNKSANFKILDVKNMKKKLEWFPKYNLSKGLDKTIRWYKNTNK